MRDLKELLEPLGDRPMPDRWDAIQRRSVGPLPEPHRSRLGAGIAAGVVAVLAIAAIVWLSPLSGSDEAPAGLGDPSTWPRYVSPDGWSAPVPPSWTAKFYSGPPYPSTYGSVVSNPSATNVIPASGDLLSVDLPADGIAMAVFQPPSLGKAGETGSASPRFAHTPLMWSDLHFEDVGAGSVGGLLFEGPRSIFGVSVKMGDHPSSTDVDAMKHVLEGITFDDSSGQLPSPSGAPGLPTHDVVVDGRFVSNVVLDDGAFSVQPAPIGTVPVVPKEDAEKILLASPLFRGMPDGVVGFGLVTSKVSQYGVPSYKADPAWIAFGWGGVTNCPNLTAPPSPADLPSSGYVAVALIEGAGGGDLSYEARSDTCGTLTGPTVRPATYIGSIPWTANGRVTGGTIQITYTLPACGTLAGYRAGGQGRVDTLSVEAEVPDSPGLCSSPSPTTDVVQLGPAGGPTITTVRHAPTGVVRQAGF